MAEIIEIGFDKIKPLDLVFDDHCLFLLDDKVAPSGLRLRSIPRSWWETGGADWQGYSIVMEQNFAGSCQPCGARAPSGGRGVRWRPFNNHSATNLQHYSRTKNKGTTALEFLG